MAGAARGVVPRVVASALGLVVAAAVFTVVAHAVGGQPDSSHRLRAVMPAAASVTTPVLPSRLPDLAGAPIASASQPAVTGRLGIGTRPVVAPLPPQLRRGHADGVHLPSPRHPDRGHPGEPSHASPPQP